MFANNEIGTIQPIKEIGRIGLKNMASCSIQNAVQAFGQVPIDVDEYNIDMLSSSGPKINGPERNRLPFIFVKVSRSGPTGMGGAQGT